ncbi:hypothetical protein ARMGADRAFT_1014656 [Armillaria gallica]|uniref:Uncharacterized protein n=1 Tax=Armillaria gallica TaxID=47427 RepID=A0A2H3DGK2_ARMGA|nr:hypothetical protein ARMGADRAFT_1014656 [Armillaria gallica]
MSARICSRKKWVTRQSTEVNLDIARWATKDLGGILPTDKKIWWSPEYPWGRFLPVA